MSARAVTAIAWREFRERWLLLPTAVVVGSSPWLLGRLYGPWADEQARNAVAGIYVVAFGLLAAMMVGWSLATRDLLERRLAFYFARPVGTWSLLGGQLLAGMALVSLAGLGVALLPATTMTDLVERASRDVWGLLSGPIAANLAVLFATALVSAGLAIAFRVRSRWLLLDLVALGLLGLAVRHAALRLDEELTRIAYWPWVVVLQCTGIALPFLAGLAAQAVWGRGDPQRAHRAFSLVTWPLALLAAGLGLLVLESALVGSVANPPIPARTTMSPDGRWRGWATRRTAWLMGSTLFLQRTDGAEVLRLGALPLVSGPAFSSDSRRAAWRRLSRTARSESWVVAELGGGGVREVRSFERSVDPRSASVFHTALALDSDGRRLAVVSRADVRVYDVDRGRVLHEIPLNLRTGFVERAWFIGGDLLCLRATVSRQRGLTYRIGLPQGTVSEGPGPAAACD